MTFAEWLEFERRTNQMTAAARAIAHPNYYKVLNQLDGIVAELRHAALTLCDSEAPTQTRTEASMRLHLLFTTV